MIKKYLFLLHLSIKKMRTYKMDFLLNFISVFIWIGTGILSVMMFFYNGITFGGWNVYEALLLYGMWTTTFSLYNILGSGLFEVENYIVSGKLDIVLTKPINPLCQILFSKINPMGVSFLIVGLITMVVAFFRMNYHLSEVEIIFLIISMGSGGLLIFSIYLVIATFSFWVLKTSNGIRVGYDLHKFVQYPINIYSKNIRFILCTIIPFAFSNYFPIAAILHKVEFEMGVLSLCVSFFVFIGAYLFWKTGLRKYEGSGA